MLMNLLEFVVSEYDSLAALVIFLIVVVVTLFKWEYRLPISIIGSSLLLMLNILNYDDFLRYMNFNIVIFLLGMMVIVGYLEENNYFTYLISKIIKYMHGSGYRLFIIMMFLSAFFSALVDQVTAILFLSALSFELSSLYETDPYPLLIAILFSIIVGGTATVIGDPVSLIIAFQGNLTMTDFLHWAAPITLLTLGVLIIYIILIFRRHVRGLTKSMESKDLVSVKSVLMSNQARNVGFSTTILILVLILIMLHGYIASFLNNYLGFSLDSNTTLMLAPLIISGIVLSKDVELGRRIIIHRVDWDTLLFFVFFFIIVGSLDKTGILLVFRDIIIGYSGESTFKMFLLVAFITGLLSIFVANIMTVATLAPVIKLLYLKGLYVFPIWWAMLFSSVYMGISTPIGTTASLVLLGLLDKRRVERIPLHTWMKIGLPIAFISTIFALLILFLWFF